MEEENDEAVVNATQTELSFFMVLVFVILLGFYLTEHNDKGGTGTLAEGGPFSNPLENAVKIGIAAEVNNLPQTEIGEKSRDRTEGVLLAGEQIRNCHIESIDNRISIEAGSGPELLFPIGDFHLTEKGQVCLAEACPALIQKYLIEREQLEAVHIEGYSSRDWARPGCDNYPPLTGDADRIALLCNSILSFRRAVEVFDTCLQFNKASQMIDDQEFIEAFRPMGRGSSKPIIGKAGHEVLEKNRRVEFVFVKKST